jgi:flagellar FliJ protein
VKRKFPLAAVLRVRKVQTDLARAEVARAQAEANAIVAEVFASEVRLTRAMGELPKDSAAWLGVVHARAARASEVSLARARADEARLVVDGTLRLWSSARAAERGVERLSERHTEAVRKADEHAEQVALDEVSTTPRPVTVVLRPEVSP